jgi:hypothetical protein
VIVDPTIPARPDGVRGRHRVQRGAKCPDTGRITGATPAEHVAENLLRIHGHDGKPVTRRRAR